MLAIGADALATDGGGGRATLLLVAHPKHEQVAGRPQRRGQVKRAEQAVLLNRHDVARRQADLQRDLSKRGKLEKGRGAAPERAAVLFTRARGSWGRGTNARAARIPSRNVVDTATRSRNRERGPPMSRVDACQSAFIGQQPVHGFGPCLRAFPCCVLLTSDSGGGELCAEERGPRVA